MGETPLRTVDVLGTKPVMSGTFYRDQLADHGEQLVLIVEDGGPGIPDHKISAVNAGEETASNTVLGSACGLSSGAQTRSVRTSITPTASPAGRGS